MTTKPPDPEDLFPVSIFRNLCKQFLIDTSRLALAPQGVNEVFGHVIQGDRRALSGRWGLS